jgi:hypothetical protein
MEDIIRMFLINCLFVLAILMIFAFYLIHKIYCKLKVNHPDVYKSLGEPTVFFNYSIKKGFLVGKFLKTQKYLELKDMALTKLCGFYSKYVKFLQILVVIYMISGAGYLFIYYL